MNVLIHQYLDQYARTQPDSDAVCCLDKTLSYHQLLQDSNKLANFLIEHGVCKGDRVGIYLDKSLEMGTALYGILKSGAAYVPLDPNAPVQRLGEIIEDCQIKVVVSASNKLKKLMQVAGLLSAEIQVVGPIPEVSLPFQCYSWSSVFEQSSSTLAESKIIESDLAYIIYTSGSTGKPKGIMHTHQSGLTYARWAAAEFDVCAIDRLGNHSPLHFDISIFDWFSGLVKGACTIVIPDEYTKFPASYSQLIADSGMTILFTVPFALIQLSVRGVLEERDMNQLRLVMYGGEPFPVKHLRELMVQLPHTQFENVYGPAEINGCTRFTIKDVQPDATAVSIGKICQIAESLIVDENNQPVAIGEPGELLVRTPTMMQGYWARPDLNEKAFYLRQPVSKCSEEYQQRFYRTGDLIKQTADGNLWFLGRKDRQVKVRGYRIELDEIEAALVDFESIEEAAVYAVRIEESQVEIYASYTANENATCDPVAINRYLKSKLPSYALPAKLFSREDFPRTTSGKINRKALTQEVNNDCC